MAPKQVKWPSGRRSSQPVTKKSSSSPKDSVFWAVFECVKRVFLCFKRSFEVKIVVQNGFSALSWSQSTKTSVAQNQIRPYTPPKHSYIMLCFASATGRDQVNRGRCTGIGAGSGVGTNMRCSLHISWGCLVPPDPQRETPR